MKFAKVVFTLAGIWGILNILPLYFVFDLIGDKAPPAINHPEFYYGFAGVTLAWQFVFLLIGKDPKRYGFMMLPSILEKFAFVIAVLVLFVQHRVSIQAALPATPDCVLGVLFTLSFIKTRPREYAPELS